MCGFGQPATMVPRAYCVLKDPVVLETPKNERMVQPFRAVLQQFTLEHEHELVHFVIGGTPYLLGYLN